MLAFIGLLLLGTVGHICDAYYFYYNYPYNSNQYYQSTRSTCPCPDGSYSSTQCQHSLTNPTQCGQTTNQLYTCTTVRNGHSYCCPKSIGSCTGGQQTSIPCNLQSTTSTCATGTTCQNSTNGFAYCCPQTTTTLGVCPNSQTSNIQCTNGGCGNVGLICTQTTQGPFCCSTSQTQTGTLATQATAVLSNPTTSGNVIQGTFTFSQANTASNQVTISGTILSQSISGSFGIHIHQNGGIGNGCVNTGTDFNPDFTTHGGLNSNPSHSGDLGNIQLTAGLNSQFSVTVNNLSLNGKYSAIGRSLVIHSNADDLGFGIGNSKIDGNSGGFLACGVIGITAEQQQ